MSRFIAPSRTTSGPLGAEACQGASECGARLREAGIEPKELQATVISHLHHDHGDGLGDLVEAPIIVSRPHWDAFRRPIPATLEGAVPQHWPSGFTPKLVDATGPTLGPWEAT